MNYKEKTQAELATHASRITGLNALVGLDGFVDRILTPVDKRYGPGDHFDPLKTITAFGERVLAAAGKSTNIEMFPVQEKLGGNGPIMANALYQGGLPTRYLGALGDPDVVPVFKTFAAQTQAVTIAEPGLTNALEFEDGKLMLNSMGGLDAITYDSIVAKVGEGLFFDMISRADLIAWVNWTMIAHMTGFFNDLLNRVLPTLGPRDHRIFFFDLADPGKRTDADILGVLRLLHRFQSYGSAILGLNLSEAQQISRVLGLGSFENDADGLKKMASSIRAEVDVSCVVIHPTDSAACATQDDAVWTKGPFTAKPKITTGAGDHFNAGFCIGRLLDLSLEASLTLAVSFSGYYVRNAKSPSLHDIGPFLQQA
jgi:sugar/nucleoside kinase (ribokinase family)